MAFPVALMGTLIWLTSLTRRATFRSWRFVLLPAGRGDSDQRSSVPASDQRPAQQSSPTDAAAAEDQRPAARHRDHVTDQSVLVVVHQHVPLLHTSPGQVPFIIYYHYLQVHACAGNWVTLEVFHLSTRPVSCTHLSVFGFTWFVRSHLKSMPCP